jgi:pimeloyl-ACP methyl ester carboxylesterase
MSTQFLTTPSQRRIAYKSSTSGGKVTFVWLSGFNSDMSGTKVLSLESWAQQEGVNFVAFDYSGHGLSDGDFADGTISAWREDALAVIDERTAGDLILVGSSMGGWLALLSAMARPQRVKGLVLIAPAPDFTEKLMWPDFSATAKAEIMENGRYMRPSDYGEPYPITRDLIEDGRKWQILDSDITFTGPVRILQGMADADVPWQHAQQLVSKMTSQDLVFSLIKDGDHRLSRDQDIARLKLTCTEIMSAI